MASNVTVELEGSPLKKTSIKTTPAMALKAIVTSACEKLKLADPDSFGIKYQRNMLDLSLSVRFANLPAGAKLFLVKGKSSTLQQSSPSIAASTSTTSTDGAAMQPSSTPAKPAETRLKVQEVTVALQVEDGGRLIQKFPVTTTLWDILRFHEAQDTNLNLIRRTGIPPLNKPGMPKALRAIAEKAQKPVYMLPVLVFMNREFGTFDSLKSTTLMSAGLGSGNGVFRLLFRYTESSLSDMLPEIERACSEPVYVPPPQATQPEKAPVKVMKKEETASVSNTLSAVSISDSSNAQNAGNGVTPMDVDPTSNLSKNPADEDEPHAPFDRDIKIYKPPVETSTPLSSIELPDSFFELSPAEMKLVLASHKSKTKSLDDAPLMTKKMREREEEARRQKYPKTMIRVKFPDRFTLQAAFLSNEPVEILYHLVSTHLSTPSRAFELFLTPPLRVLSDPKTDFWNAGLAPSSVVYFRWGDHETHGPFLGTESLKRAEEFPVVGVEVPVVVEEQTKKEEEVKKEGGFRLGGGGSSSLSSVERGYQVQRDSGDSREKEEGGKKVPRWLKL
ncbi:Tether containing UBX domain for GLUT4, partial [Chytridiales sp. JEL 0842]